MPHEDEFRPKKMIIRGREILKPGRYTDMRGLKFRVTAKHLQETVNNFNPEEHQPQINFTHMSNQASAGQVSRLYMVGDVLTADLSDIDPFLAKEMVPGGDWPYVSVDWELPPLNRLVGLALLGSEKPAVEGLNRVRPGQIHEQVASFKLGDQIFYCKEPSMSDMAELGELKSMVKELASVVTDLGGTVAKLAGNKEDDQVAKLTAERDTALRESKELKEQTAADAKVVKLARAKTDSKEFVAKAYEEKRISMGMKEMGLERLLNDTILGESETMIDGDVVSLADGWMKMVGAIPGTSRPKSGEQVKPGEEGEPPEGVVSASTEAFSDTYCHPKGSPESIALKAQIAEDIKLDEERGL